MNRDEFDLIPFVVVVRPPGWNQQCEQLLWARSRAECLREATRRWSCHVIRIERVLDVCERYLR